jgi:hypothetical protein
LSFDVKGENKVLVDTKIEIKIIKNPAIPRMRHIIMIVIIMAIITIFINTFAEMRLN